MGSSRFPRNQVLWKQTKQSWFKQLGNVGTHLKIFCVKQPKQKRKKKTTNKRPLSISSFEEKLCHRLHYILSLSFYSSVEDCWCSKSCLVNKKKPTQTGTFQKRHAQAEDPVRKEPLFQLLHSTHVPSFAFIFSLSQDQAKLKYFLNSQV